MAAVLHMYLTSAGYTDVIVESAGVGDYAKTGGKPAPFGVAAAKFLGLHIGGHTRRHVETLKLDDYDLFVCAADDVARELLKFCGDRSRMFNANVANPFPVQFQQDYEPCMIAILGGMYRVVARYFPPQSFEM